MKGIKGVWSVVDNDDLTGKIAGSTGPKVQFNKPEGMTGSQYLKYTFNNKAGMPCVLNFKVEFKDSDSKPPRCDIRRKKGVFFGE